MTVQTLRMTGDEWWRPIPRGLSRDAKLILTARALRAFADGFVSVLLPVYLLELGFSVIAIGAIVTTTLIGSALLTLWVGIYAHRHKRRLMLLGACVLMAATGAGFALTSQFWPLLIIAFVGTLNPSSGDVSVFLPLEHTVLAQAADPQQRTALFARYSLAGALSGAVGTLAASLPDLAVEHTGMTHLAAMQAMFWLYGLIGALAFLLYDPLSPAIEAQAEARPVPLKQTMVQLDDSTGSPAAEKPNRIVVPPPPTVPQTPGLENPLRQGVERSPGSDRLPGVRAAPVEQSAGVCSHPCPREEGIHLRRRLRGCRCARLRRDR